jgi:BlaI family transcriptional regulator, penicillinase repressor
LPDEWPFSFWGFKSPHEVLENCLGSLERDVMTVVWDGGETNVKDVTGKLSSPVAYTTVMPTMDRLFKKGLLTRRKVGRAFVYRAAATRNEIEEAVVTELMQSLFNRPGNVSLPLLSSLVDAVSDKDRALLDDLERLIHEKKRKMNDESNR